LFETKYSWQHMEERWKIFFDELLAAKDQVNKIVEIQPL
jgi:hypothetical protein